MGSIKRHLLHIKYIIFLKNDILILSKQKQHG